MEDSDDCGMEQDIISMRLKLELVMEIDHIVEKYHRVKNECIKFLRNYMIQRKTNLAGINLSEIKKAPTRVLFRGIERRVNI